MGYRKIDSRDDKNLHELMPVAPVASDKVEVWREGRNHVTTAGELMTGSGAVSESRSVNTTAPLTGGGNLSADRTLGIIAATTAARGTMSAADKSKLDGVAAGATANAGTVTSVALSVPTGLSVGGSPITASGTFTVTYAAGYQGYTGAEATKLAGVQAGATANSTDAALRDRATHTGTQAAATVTGLAAVATSGLKADVGLGNVDNTADAAKPVSTAQQAALDAKAALASPALTGTPTAPTAAAGTNTTQVATAAFVAENRGLSVRNVQAANYTLALADAGNTVYSFVAGHTWTIPTNAAVPFPDGTRINLIKYGAGGITIARAAGVELYWMDGATSANANRTMGGHSWAVLWKTTGDQWFIWGNNLS